MAENLKPKEEKILFNMECYARILGKGIQSASCKNTSESRVYIHKFITESTRPQCWGVL